MALRIEKKNMVQVYKDRLKAGQTHSLYMTLTHLQLMPSNQEASNH